MKPLVVLLHGLARSNRSMAKVERFLRERGYAVASRSYPSRHQPIAQLAADVADWIVAEAAGREVSAVTHSLGGVIARHIQDPRIRWQRIVMLAPPNRGSRLAGAIADSSLLRWFYGPAGVELTDGARWPLPPAPFAVIAGTRGYAAINPTWLLRRFPPGVAHDGTVSVDEARLDGMADFAEVDAHHTWIMNDARVHALVERFLADGCFSPGV